jgi:hypothetical protein
MSAIESGLPFDAAAGATATTVDGGAVTIPANAIVTSSETACSGPVSSGMTTFDPADDERSSRSRASTRAFLPPAPRCRSSRPGSWT